MGPFKDPWGRPVTSVRISVTNKCNYRCFFCHNEGQVTELDKMSPEEIGKIIGVLAKYGVKKVKITGGEPLLRNDIVEIVKEVNRPGIIDISMVTNGWRLSELAHKLADAGLNRVNISIHSLKRNIYKLITGVDGLERGLKAIDAALDAGLTPIKLNMVVLKGLNDNEIWDAIEFSRKKGVILQLIELLDSDLELFKKYYVSLLPLENKLSNMAKRIKIRGLHSRKQYFLNNGAIVEVVRGTHNPEFCKKCTRIRITHDGFFKTCIMRDDQLVDFLSPLKRGASEGELVEIYRKAVSLREPYFKEDINVNPSELAIKFFRETSEATGLTKLPPWRPVPHKKPYKRVKKRSN